MIGLTGQSLMANDRLPDLKPWLGGVFIDVSSSGVRALTIGSAEPRPVLISTDRHITQGWVDLERLAAAAATGGAAGVRVRWQRHIGDATVTIEPPLSRSASWSVSFEPATTCIYPPRRPEGLEAAVAPDGSVRLGWRPECYSIAGCRVEVDGQPVGVSFEPRAVLRGLQPGATCRLSIREVWYDDTAGRESADLAFTVPAGQR